jgi:hypothetical protein
VPDGVIRSPSDADDATAADTIKRALEYMGLTAGMTDAKTVPVDRPCSLVRAPTAASKIIRAAAAVAEGSSQLHQVKRVMVVPWKFMP